MGVSFKISKVGSRFKPKPFLSGKNSENSVESSQPKAKKDESNSFITTISARKLDGRDEDAAGFSSPSLSSGRHLILSKDEVSFVLSLYLDGYFIGKPSEGENLHNVVFQDGAKLLHPYDRSSECLFAAIESGRLPGDILEDMPCKYMDGQIICEVRDYRRRILDSGCKIPSRDVSPAVTKVQLKMSLENVVKDIPSIADDSWSYGDLMEVESRILRALQPKLCLDPTPRLERLSNSSRFPELDLGLSGMRKRRLRQINDVGTSYSKPHGKKTCMGSFSESSGLGESGVVSADIISQPAHTQNVCPNVPSTRSRGSVHDNSLQAIHVASPELKFQLGDQRIMPHIPGSALNTSSGAFPSVHDMTKVHLDNMNSTNLLHAKMEREEGQLSSFSSLNKKARHFGPEGTLPPQMSSCTNSLQPSDMQWRNPPHHQGNARGMHFPNTDIQKYSQVMCDGASNQEGMTSAPIGPLGRKYGVSGERFETEKIDTPEVKRGKNVMQMFDAENNHMDPSILQRLPTQIMRSGLNQGVWNNIGYVDKDPRKDDLIQKRKLIQSPRNSTGSGAHFPLSAKSAELSCSSLANQYAAVPSAAAPGSLQREKSSVPSILAGGRTPSVNSSANDSVHQHHQSHGSAKRRSNSLPKTQAMSGVGSPASVSNANVPMNAASPSVGTSPLADHALFERFSKIEMVNMKHQLNSKKSRSEDFSRTSSTFSSQLLRAHLADSTNNDESTLSLSKSLAGGNINLPKIRVLTLILAERTLQGNSVPVPPRAKTRMIMSEKPADGTVAMHYGDLEDVPYLNAEDYLPNLANTHFADLLAAEFYRLVHREGCYYVEDHVHCRPPHISISTSTQPSASGVGLSNPTMEMQQHSEAVSAPQTGEGAKPFSANTSVNPSPNFLPSSGMLPPGSPQALQMSQGLLHGVSMPARSQQLDPPQTHQQQQSPLQNQPSLIQPQQQQQTQFQRSFMMPQNSLSPIQNSNFQLGNQMMNKPSLQVLQQQQQPQLQPQMQQQQMQRKMMPGTAMGMGNMANNMAGGLNIAGARGIGATRITAPTVAMPGTGNMGQNPMSISHASNFSNALSQHLRSGLFTQAQAQMITSRMKMTQNRGMLGGPQSSVTDIAGTRQVQPGSTGHSMLGQALNRGNLSPMQRTPLGQMTAQYRTLMPGMHAHVSPQQQQQQQMQQQQQLQLRQQLQQQQLQQLQQLPPPTTQLHQETSSLQAVVSPQISSPSTLGLPHSLNQQPTPQQQQASPQISSGTMQPMASANPEAGAASPQLSSGANFANSPMDFQGVNKSSSFGNT